MTQDCVNLDLMLKYLHILFTILFIGGGAASVDAVSPLTGTEVPDFAVRDIASINSWTPELPALQPVQPVEESPEYIDDLISYAKNYIGLHYRRGGKTLKGFDCSGFTSYVFKQFGLPLNASSRSQYTQGDHIIKEELLPGDLVFFSGRRGGTRSVGHVGIVVEVDADGTFKFIHSAISSGITISDSTEPYYRSRYVGARRVR